MFHMSLKYIHLVHVSTSLQVTFFFKESITLRTLWLVLSSMLLYIYLWCYMVSPLPIFLYCGCSVTQHAHDQEAAHPYLD
jgi:hypothetical protein